MAIFADLPAELRAQIWDLCLPDPLTPGIYFFEPPTPDRAVQEAPTALLTSLPVLLHLCHEARAHARFRLTFTPVPGGRLEVPCRPYRPATDVLAVRGGENLAAFCEVPSSSTTTTSSGGHGGVAPRSLYRTITHLALDAGVFARRHETMLDDLFPRLTALRKLSVVFHGVGSSKQDALDPWRRYLLVLCTATPPALTPWRPSRDHSWLLQTQHKKRQYIALYPHGPSGC